MLTDRHIVGALDVMKMVAIVEAVKYFTTKEDDLKATSAKQILFEVIPYIFLLFLKTYINF